MKSKLLMVAAALLALMLCGAAMLSYAQESSQATSVWQGHRHSRMAYLSRELNLTDAQKAQVKSILQANRPNIRPLRLQMTQNRQALLAATANGAYDQAKVQALALQQGQLMAQLMMQKQAVQHQIYTQVLTPEQQATAEQLRAKQLARLTSRIQKLSQSSSQSTQQ